LNQTNFQRIGVYDESLVTFHQKKKHRGANKNHEAKKKTTARDKFVLT
jgi:hypothetical protein